MARDITSGFQDEIEASQLNPILLTKAEFDSGTLRFWTGHGDLDFNGETYVGAGNFLGISSVKETQDFIANKVEFALTGIDSSILSIALDENFQGRNITLWFAVLDTNGALISDPYQMFSGKMDTMSISDQGTSSSVSVVAESDIVDFKLLRERKYTDEDQKAAFPNDRGLEFITTIQDVQITWGVGQ